MAETQATTDTPTVTIDGVTLTHITLEDYGDFFCVEEFWDCECTDTDKYIHIRNRSGNNRCPVCGEDADDEDDFRPDSRLIEVLERYPELWTMPWLTARAWLDLGPATEMDKEEVKKRMAEYLARINRYD